jgi:hypothetical protein
MSLNIAASIPVENSCVEPPDAAGIGLKRRMSFIA